ncbi:hypothetical protein [Arsenicicoccus dermatophilus]|uniref:hypothetical protein n=1 Tax=Arsenicicoccus dermatophilus TaxID=1076331 RepID=UPI001F4CDDC2|nr:hypothetical protein [Arsenicicoccus dermatophilus]MCH8614445.1 hypothetical protein [Arsenicicoccus dermatophilus]
MVRRSWYLPAGAADELAAAVDELHWQTRRPKHEVLVAVLHAGLAHLDQARDALDRPGDHSPTHQ